MHGDEKAMKYGFGKQELPWGRDVDETFRELAQDDIDEMIRKARRRNGPKRQVYTLWLGATTLEIEVRRVVP